MPEPAQLTLFCRACLGHLVIAVTTTDRHGEPVTVPAPCPICRLRPAARETWLAAVAVAERLTAGAQQ